MPVQLVRSLVVNDPALRAGAEMIDEKGTHRTHTGLRFGRFVGEDRHPTSGAGRLLRLPLYYGFRQVGRSANGVGAFVS